MSVMNQHDQIVLAFGKMIGDIKIIEGNIELMIAQCQKPEMETAAYVAIPPQENNVLFDKILQIIKAFPLAADSILMDLLLEAQMDANVLLNILSQKSRLVKKSTLKRYKNLLFGNLSQIVMMLEIEQQKQLNKQVLDLQKGTLSLVRDVYGLGKSQIFPEIERRAQDEKDLSSNAQNQGGSNGNRDNNKGKT